MARTFIFLIVVLALMSCSVLVLNHSSGNIVRDDTEPLVTTDVDTNLHYTKKGLHIGKETVDTIK